MQSTDVSGSLRQYAENHSDEAFAALVAQHINLVYSVALRHVGDPQDAEEVTQAVFILLSKKAAQLRHDKALSSWLFQTTRLTASNFVRGRTRRQRREQEAHMQCLLDRSGNDVWQRIAPLLDSAVAALSERDRRAIVLRFYEGRNLRDVGVGLDASEDAAEKRVGRALQKLRLFFVKRGVSVSASGVLLAISTNAVQTAPAGLAGSIVSAATLAGTTFTAAATLTATKAIAMTTLQKTLVVAAIVAAGVTIPLIIRDRDKLRAENESLRQQLEGLRETAAKSERMAASKRPQPLSNDDPFRELLKLRNEVGQLRKQTAELEKLRAANRQVRPAQDSQPPAQPAQPVQDYFPKESWAFVGYDAPESALQSTMWAMSKGDLKTYLASMVPEEQARMAKEFAGKSEFDIAAQASRELEKIKAFRVLKKDILSDDQVVLTFFGEGKDETVKLKFQRSGNEWKIAGPAGKN